MLQKLLEASHLAQSSLSNGRFHFFVDFCFSSNLLLQFNMACSFLSSQCWSFKLITSMQSVFVMFSICSFNGFVNLDLMLCIVGLNFFNRPYIHYIRLCYINWMKLYPWTIKAECQAWNLWHLIKENDMKLAVCPTLPS